MQNSKIQSYLGFAKKSNDIIYGIDNLKEYNKKMPLVIYSDEISERSLKVLNNLVEEKKWKMIKLKNLKLDDLLFTQNCKVIGIKNENLSKAILEQAEYIEILN